MRVTVFGASGRVGQLVVQKLIDDEHEVTAFVHHASPFKKNKHIVVRKGDIHNPSDVKKAVQGSDMIVSTLGSWGTKDKNIVSSGMANIIAAMSGYGINRVVSLTGSDAWAAEDQQQTTDRLLHFAIKLTPARKILNDGEKHIKLLENSSLDWTVLRSPIMNSAGRASDSMLSNVKPRPWETINRQAVANTIVELLRDKKYYRRAPFIRRSK